MSPDTLFYTLGVIGYPLDHSLSPRLHEAALRASGLQGEYQLYPVPPLPGGRECLEVLINSLRAGRLDGLNVTIPHKQTVLPYLDELTPLASQIGAINTIYRWNGYLVGDNTDAPGFIADLHKKYPSTDTPKAALVLGAGGAARAVIYALLSAGWQVTIAARRPEMAIGIIDSYSFIHQSCEVIGLESLTQFILNGNIHQRELCGAYVSLRRDDHQSLSLIVNTTPVGMVPNVTHSPWPEDLPFPRGVFLYDLVYNPVDTALVRAARAAGLAAVGGLGMLIEQAAISFECWTGICPDIEAMCQAIATELDVSTFTHRESVE